MALNVTIVLTEGLRWPLSKCPQDLLLGPLGLWSWAQRRAPVRISWWLICPCQTDGSVLLLIWGHGNSISKSSDYRPRLAFGTGVYVRTDLAWISSRCSISREITLFASPLQQLISLHLCNPLPAEIPLSFQLWLPEFFIYMLPLVIIPSILQ